MLSLNLAAGILTATALFAWFNQRFIGLPPTIGVMVISLVFSFLAIVAEWSGIAWAGDAAATAAGWVAQVDFTTILMHGMLSFLLFAGALHVNLNDLMQYKWNIAALASIGVMTSTAIIGFGSYYLLGFLGLDTPLIYCLLFGALISPTDPIAVMAILKNAGASKAMSTHISGESLFNDGIGVVVFLVLLGVLKAGTPPTVGQVLTLFLEEAVGGAILGIVVGGIGFALLRGINQYHAEVLITLAMVMGGYALATSLHLSGPIAVVVMGLMIGNHGRRLAMSTESRQRLDDFWELLDEILNALLFVLIGLELIVISLRGDYITAGLLLIPLTLAARLTACSIPLHLIPGVRAPGAHSAKILTWCGLRGGISVALALSLPESSERELIVTVTYVIVLFSIIVQGLTVAPVVKRLGQ